MKRMLLLLSAGAVLGISACNAPAAPSSAPGAPSAAPAALIDSTGSPEKVARSMFAAFNRHDWKAMAECYTDSAWFLDPSLGKTPVHQSHQQTIDKYTGLAAMFPDIRDDIQQIYVSGDHVTVEFVSRGSSPRAGKLEVPICTVLTIKDGKIVRDGTYFDQ